MRSFSKTLLAGSALFVGVWFASSCGTEQNMICTPGEKAECECPDGTPSTKTCLEDGSDWGPCECGGDSGSGSGGSGSGGSGSGGSAMQGAGGGGGASSGGPASSAMSSGGMVASSSSTGGPLPGCQEDDCVACRSSECAKLVCSTEIAACEANPDCVSLKLCLGQCAGDLECPDVCFDTYKGGLTDYSAESTCLFCHPDACRALCDVDMTCM